MKVTYQQYKSLRSVTSQLTFTGLVFSRFLDLSENEGNVKGKPCFPPIDWPLKSDYSTLTFTCLKSTIDVICYIIHAYVKLCDICFKLTLKTRHH